MTHKSTHKITHKTRSRAVPGSHDQSTILQAGDEFEANTRMQDDSCNNIKTRRLDTLSQHESRWVKEKKWCSGQDLNLHGI